MGDYRNKKTSTLGNRLATAAKEARAYARDEDEALKKAKDVASEVKPVSGK